MDKKMLCENKILKKAVFYFVVFFLSVSAGFSNAAEDSIHVAMPAGPASLNYFSGTDTWTQRILRFFYMPLYVYGPGGEKMVPWLAESLPVVDEASKTATIRLRHAKWNDASPVTVADLIFTVSVIQEFGIPGHVEKWRDVVKMEALDSRTVRFTYKGPAPGFFNRALFAPFVPKKNWIAAVKSARTSNDPLGTFLGFSPETIFSNGPFVLQTYTKPLFMVLKHNPHFFGRGRTIEGISIGPYLDTVIFEFNRNIEKCLNQLSTGNIDFLWCDLPVDAVPRLMKMPHVSIFNTDRTGYDYLAFNLERDPFSDVSFRRAVALMTDRQQILRRIGKGNGSPVYSVIPPQNTLWSNPHVVDPGAGLTLDQRTEKALVILKGAGYSWTDGHLMLPDGREMKPMEILITREWRKPFRLKIALEIRKALSRIGISVTHRIQPLHTLMDLLKKGSFDAFIMGWTHLSRDPDYLQTFFHSREARSGGKNYARFRNTAFDELAEKASTEKDPLKRKIYVFDMQALIAREVPWVPLYTGPRVEAARNDHFRGWVKMPGGIGNLWSFIHLQPMRQATMGGF